MAKKCIECRIPVSTQHNLLLACFQETKLRENSIVTVLVDFAIALMTVLDHINKESFQRFKLRVGK